VGTQATCPSLCAWQMGFTHEPVVSRLTSVRSVDLESVSPPLPMTDIRINANYSSDVRQTDAKADRKAHLPTSETKPPPPGPEGLPIKRLQPKAQKANPTRASSVRSMRSTSSYGADQQPPVADPVTVLMEMHIEAEIVPESADYYHVVEDPARQLVLAPLQHIRPDHPQLAEIHGKLGGDALEKSMGYVDEGMLDEEGGDLVRGVLESSLQEVLGSEDLKQTFAELRDEDRDPYFAEMKPPRAFYDIVGEALGVGRREKYQVARRTIIPRMKEFGVPIKFKILKQAIKAVVEEQRKKNPEVHLIREEEEVVDLRRLAMRLPNKMRNVLETYLLMKAHADNRARRHSTGNHQHHQPDNNFLSIERAGTVAPGWLQTKSPKPGPEDDQLALSMLPDATLSSKDPKVITRPQSSRFWSLRLTSSDVCSD
jgi:hypothetical protein